MQGDHLCGVVLHPDAERRDCLPDPVLPKHRMAYLYRWASCLRWASGVHVQPYRKGFGGPDSHVLWNGSEHLRSSDDEVPGLLAGNQHSSNDLFQDSPDHDQLQDQRLLQLEHCNLGFELHGSIYSCIHHLEGIAGRVGFASFLYYLCRTFRHRYSADLALWRQIQAEEGISGRPARWDAADCIVHFRTQEKTSSETFSIAFSP
mmetsp:Transcript_1407/g.2335  ORF Transcript_1407/g.2335 Transcript_1407/m.2335 type:complete len:204 (+) Transcript_1407:168-779(+)